MLPSLPGRRIGGARVAWALALAAAAPTLDAQAPADSATIAKPGTVGPSPTHSGTSTLSGHVEDEGGKPVGHAVVTLVGSDDSALTTDDGRFVLHVASGAYILAVRRLGFRVERFAMSMAPGEQRDVTIVESRAVPVLPTVTTTAQERAAYRAVGFEQRMKIGIGQFLTFEQIQARQATRLSQLLDRMRGIEVHIEDPKSFDYSVEGTRGVGSCVGYVVDGVPQVQLPPTVSHRGHSPDFLMDPDAVGAIEVYSSSERPAEFGPGLHERPPPIPFTPLPTIDIGAQQCALVVIWTRARLGLTGTPSTVSAPTDGGAHDGSAASPDVTHGEAVFANDASCHAPPPADTIDLAVYATIEGSPPTPMPDTAWSAYKSAVLAALDRSAALPSVFVLPTFGLPSSTGTATNARGEAVRDLAVTPTLSNVIAFTLDDSGALTDAHVAASSLSVSADTTALAMVERAAAAHAFPHRSSTSGGAGAAHLLLVTASIEPMMGMRAAVLGQLEVPRWRLTRPARLAAPRDRSDSAISSGADEGTNVTLEAVVSEAGRVIPSTVRWIGSTGGVGSAGLMDRALRLRFEPALIGRCAVPELLLQPLAK